MIGILNSIKKLFVPKLINRFNKILVKILKEVFVNLENLTIKLKLRSKEPRMANAFLKSNMLGN